MLIKYLKHSRKNYSKAFKKKTIVLLHFLNIPNNYYLGWTGNIKKIGKI